ncbi:MULTISPECIES: hypothetical protein [Acinetobacter]|uniref:Uncharacterized protein n=1 Tax=Acinetobacter piscicola TaxID=2006115 RepID=A0A7S6VY81_9GAMM|nr:MULTISPECIES: hypothetical protein [Acinetobacter]QOW46952.1 hypothetical protein G0028_14205 [Acinetobacter piscicola]
MTTINNLIDRVGGIDTAKSMLKRAKAKNLTKISYQIMVGNVQCTTGVFVNDLEEAIAQHDQLSGISREFKVGMNKFNINNYVFFKPTPLAHEIYENYYSSVGGLKLDIDSQGFAKLQLHSFMHIFGEVSFVGMGRNVSEKCEIWIKDEDLERVI